MNKLIHFSICAAIVASSAMCQGSNYYYKINLEKKYQQFSFQLCKRYHLPKELPFAIIWEESRYHQYETSDVSAMGLMQIKVSTANDMLKDMKTHDYSQYKLAVKDYGLYDKQTNIRMGVYLLNYLVRRYKNLDAAICAYEHGEGAMMKLRSERRLIGTYERNIRRDMKYLKTYGTLREGM